ncbi:UDP-N-acetylglucosamine-peptide N-acetylglucosaminyltransferase [Sorangium sp. So ce1024]|uniref:UDP-N-acetylglucosamine-peptide N-acetylglucosaminyltransferase n=1 Tax=Sorangium sp. So ce1024 TaxID=3133327 RepID=UPI003F11D2EC
MDPTLVAEVSRLHEAAWRDPAQWKLALGRAERLLREHLETEPDCIDALTSLGAVLSDTGRHLEALAELRRAEGLGSTDANTYHNLAVAMMNTSERGKARGYFEKAARRQAGAGTLQAYFDPHGH